MSTPSAFPPPGVLRIGTRGSPLARAQTELVRQSLVAAHPALADAIEVVVIRTTGDRVQDRRLAEIGGKGLFTREIEEALLDGGIDLAVHSMKDLPTVLPDGLTIGCVPARADPRDALLSPKAASIAALPLGAVVGTASLRRQAQLLAQRPDLKVVAFRGNIDTRIAKLAAGEVDATLLAAAGLHRLGRGETGGTLLDPAEMLPAVAQGALAIEVRAGDARVAGLLRPLHDEASAVCTTAERACLAALDGSCRTPIAALAELGAGVLRLRALIAKPDGSAVVRDERSGPADAPAALGEAAAAALRRQAGAGFFDPAVFGGSAPA